MAETQDTELPPRVETLADARNSVKHVLQTEFNMYGYTKLVLDDGEGNPQPVIVRPLDRAGQQIAICGLQGDRVRGNFQREAARLVLPQGEAFHFLANRLHESPEHWNRYLFRIKEGEVVPSAALRDISPMSESAKP